MVLDGLETNKFTVVEIVEGHVVITIPGLDMVGGVVVVVVVTMILGAEVADALESKRGFLLSSHCIVFSLLDGSCFYSWILSPFFS